MPAEVIILRGLPTRLERCPKCGAAPLEPFLRGQVQRSPWGLRWGWPPWYRRPYCAVICRACKEIVDWEAW